MYCKYWKVFFIGLVLTALLVNAVEAQETQKGQETNLASPTEVNQQSADFNKVSVISSLCEVKVNSEQCISDIKDILDSNSTFSENMYKLFEYVVYLLIIVFLFFVEIILRKKTAADTIHIISFLIIVFLIVNLLSVLSDLKVLLPMSIVAISGALGGLAYALTTDNVHTLALPFGGKSVPTGFLGDMMVGAVTSVATISLVGALFDNSDISKLLILSDLTGNYKTNEEQQKAFVTLFLCIGVSLLSGFSGLKLLNGLNNKFLESISESQKRVEEHSLQTEQYVRYTYCIDAGKESLKKDHHNDALDWFEDAIDILPSARALSLKAFTLYFLGKHRQALDTVNKALDLDRSKIERQVLRTLFFNKACFICNVGGDESSAREALKCLEEAVARNVPLTEIENDEDLKWLRETHKPLFDKAFAAWEKGEYNYA